MSEPGTAPAADVRQISRIWLRDLILATEILARPIGITACGLAVAAAVFLARTEEGRLGAATIAAGAFWGVAYLRSKDKQAEIGATRP